MTEENSIAAEAPSQPVGLWAKVKQELREWGATLAIVAPAFLLFTGLLYEQRVIPSESMVPSLEVGDRVAVSKFAFGYGRYSLPLSIGRYLPLGSGRFFPGTPERGDVVVFEHTHSERVMIKRVVGLPGDTVQMINEERGTPMANAVRAAPINQNRTITFVSFHPNSSKWWWMGAMRKSRRPPVARNQATWRITERASAT